MQVEVTETIWLINPEEPDGGVYVPLVFVKHSGSKTIIMKLEGQEFKVSSEDLYNIAFQLN